MTFPGAFPFPITKATEQAFWAIHTFEILTQFSVFSFFDEFDVTERHFWPEAATWFHFDGIQMNEQLSSSPSEVLEKQICIFIEVLIEHGFVFWHLME